MAYYNFTVSPGSGKQLTYEGCMVEAVVEKQDPDLTYDYYVVNDVVYRLGGIYTHVTISEPGVYRILMDECECPPFNSPVVSINEADVAAGGVGGGDTGNSGGTLAVELSYAETITLAAVDDLVSIPVHIWRSYGIYVKSGAVLVSTDGGSTFPATYDDTDLPVMWGNGNSDELDSTQIVIKASIAPAVIQAIGDYI